MVDYKYLVHVCQSSHMCFNIVSPDLGSTISNCALNYRMRKSLGKTRRKVGLLTSVWLVVRHGDSSRVELYYMSSITCF